MRPAAASMIEDSYVGIDAAKDILDDAERWAVPGPSESVSQEVLTKAMRAYAPSVRSTAQLIWATASFSHLLGSIVDSFVEHCSWSLVRSSFMIHDLLDTTQYVNTAHDPQPAAEF